MNIPSSETLTPALRTSDPEQLATEILERLKYRIGKDPKVAKPHDWLTAAILVARDRVTDNWMDSTKRTYAEGRKRVYYLSLEFLIGRLMRDTMTNIGIMDEMRIALASLGVDIDVIAELEPDAALGNGGLGRLAACFMESMATVDVPAYGYGIRYVHGLFRQQMSDGWQVELPENWLAHGNPWEFERRESSYEIGFGGSVDTVDVGDEAIRYVWKPAERVIATAYDTPVAGWRGQRVNTLRLWTATPIDPILLDAFNAGDHIGALRESNKAESLARVLYPADATPAGQELRLRQEFFFSSASLQDILRRHLQQFPDFTSLPDAWRSSSTIHTRPSPWPSLSASSWTCTGSTSNRRGASPRPFSYTNHTLLPEALESWPVPLFERLLPRHMQIVYAINAMILMEARRQKTIPTSRSARSR